MHYTMWIPFEDNIIVTQVDYNKNSIEETNP